MDRIAALLRRSVTDPRPDGELLAAFLGDHDDAAFGELVRRHGPAVWGVCRRALPNLADAEDVFQATFLVLTRRASRLTAARTVGPWLFEVATRTAANARRKNSRRRALFAEIPDAVADPRPPTAHLTDLDTILLGLPERYRAVLLMCYLEGLTHREAADRLGCAEGTVSSLVSRGLAKLRAKFAGRAPAAVLGAAGAVAPAGLTAATVRSAVASRLGFPSAAVPPAIIALTHGVLRMCWIKKAGAAAVLAAMFLAVVVGLDLSVGQSPRAAGQEKPSPKKGELAPPPRPPGEEGKGQANKGGGKLSLNGHWLLVAKETDGEKKEFPQGVGIELVISDDALMIIDFPENVFGGKHRSGSTSTCHWRLVAPADGKPRGIDLVSKAEEKVAWKEGIYTLDGDQLTICWGEEKRPTEFTTKTGSGSTLNAFKRISGGGGKDVTPPKPAQPDTKGKADGK
jgi:RNA polymerase sigma factor (sigma-70 family)